MLTISLLLTCSSFATPLEEWTAGLNLEVSAILWAQEPEEVVVEDEQEPEEGELVEEEVEEEEFVEEELTPAEAVMMLETALKSRELDLIFAALDDAGMVAHKDVIKQLGKAVKYKDTEVRLNAIVALRFNQDPTAFKELLKLKKYKPVLENELCAEAYFMALGQKADVKGLPILTDKLHVTNRNDKPTRARIVAIGRIRDAKSVEALISMMNSGKGRRAHPNMKEINLALQVLTGADIKPNRDTWQAWWNDNKKGLKITKEEQEASSKKARATWKMLWANPDDAEMMKEALKRGKTDFADADEEELQRLRELAEKRKKAAEDKGKGDGSEEEF